MKSNIKLKKEQAELFIMLIQYHIKEDIGEENLLLFCWQAVLVEFINKLMKKYDWSDPKKVKKVKLSLPEHHALTFLIENIETDDPWVIAEVIDFRAQLDKQYTATIGYMS